MGLILPITLLAGAVIALYDTRRTSGVLAPNALRPLGQATQDAIDQLSTQPGPNEPSMSLTMREIYLIAINSRAMVRESDRLRNLGVHSNRLDAEHAEFAVIDHKLSRLILCAFLEKALCKEGLYSTATAWYYSEQRFAIDDMARTAGIPLPESWED